MATFTVNGTTLNKSPLRDFKALDLSMYYRDDEGTQRRAEGEIKAVIDISGYITSSEITAIANAVSSNPITISTTGYPTNNLSGDYSIRDFNYSERWIKDGAGTRYFAFSMRIEEV